MGRLGFLGVALLLLPGERPDAATFGGILIVVAAAFCWASGSFATSHWSCRADPIGTTAWQMLVGGAVDERLVGLLAGEAGEVDFAAFSPSPCGVRLPRPRRVARRVHRVRVAAQHAPISQVATYAYVNPVVAIALGAVFVDEEVTPLVGVAAAVIVASVAGTIRQEAPRARGGGRPNHGRRKARRR